MIIVIGYYDHGNIGDEQYKLTIPLFMKMYMNIKDEYTFIDCDQLNSDFKVYDSDLIIFGGGDVLNDYFMKKLNLFKNNKIIALSVGIPFLLDNKGNDIDLCVFDKVYLRTTQDIKYYNVNYIPDLSWYLRYIKSNCFEIVSDKKIISLSLCRISNISISDILSNIKCLIDRLDEYQFVLVTFNNNKVNLDENDYSIHKELKDMCPSVILLDPLGPKNTFDIYKFFYATISMRFHGCVFSVYNNVPFIAINDSRKIRNLQNDIGIQGTVFNTESIINALNNINRSKFEIYNKNVCKYFKFKNKVISKEMSLDEYVSNVYDVIKKSTSDKETIVKAVSYYITGYSSHPTFDSIYNYGLIMKMFDSNGFKVDYDFKNEIKWAIKDHFSKKVSEPLKVSNFKINITYKGQRSETVHRSGWNYVYDNLVKYNDPSGPLLDMYLDETFHWNYDLYKLVGVVPYTKPWYGFIHHTFYEDSGDYNCEKLLKNADFIESLSTCKGLIVLSNTLKDKFMSELYKLKIEVNIYVMYHPTEFVSNKFTMEKFDKNNDKKVMNVGTWLRDTYFFYKMTPTLTKRKCIFVNKKIPIRKVALTGRHGSNYFPDPHLEELMIDSIKDKSVKRCSHDIQNTWYKSMFIDLDRIKSTVELIKYTDDWGFDTLLESNIILIKLFDASAVNTLIECVVRNTPILINKLPAVVEILGNDYPGYLTESDIKREQVNIKYSDIVNMYKYLVKLDKSNLMIETFVNKLKNIIQ